jgi:hypothetical protein
LEHCEQSTQSVDDALSFLLSSGLLCQEGGQLKAQDLLPKPFRIKLLKVLRQLERGERPVEHVLDPLYTLLLTELFIKPDVLFVEDMHAKANKSEAVKERGGLSQEKIRSWSRVMTFLGVGYRVRKGFLCSYEPMLLIEVLQDWQKERGILQYFLEEQLGGLLPYARADGDLSIAVKQPLLDLQEKHHLALFALQDSPTRSYFGIHHYKGLAWGGEYA